MSGLRSLSWSLGKRNPPGPVSETGEARRYSDHYVVFQHQFTLGESQEVYPPGRYAVETAEESIERSGYTAHIRTATSLVVPTASGTRAIQIQADELQAALEADAGGEQRAAPSDDPHGGNAESESSEAGGAESLQAQLERYGIERVPSDVFVCGGHRYTHACDAIAAAKRAAKA